MKAASRFEILAARLWNVLNEGKSFHPVFVLGIFLLLHLPELASANFWGRALPALVVAAPLVLIFVVYDFPLKLRTALWVYLAAFVMLFRFVDLPALVLALALYVFFTVFFWGTLYYHLRTGAPRNNFLRFWRLVLENPDSTSGNFLEQVPKALLALFALEYLVGEPIGGGGRVLAVLGFTAVVGVASYLVHRFFFDWKPVYSEEPTQDANRGAPLARRVIVVIIDGCRLDRFREAEKPYLERMMANGTVFESVETVYPARTVVCFSSMLTGAAPESHGIRSNLVLKLGLKVESIFDVLRRHGKVGKLVGIAHLIDAFGHEDVASVTSVAHNDKIDGNLIAAARRELAAHDPDLLVLQLLAVDQNGHVRGTYYPEYVERIEITDRLIEEFMAWCEEGGYLRDAAVILMADHGQGRGIGAHGHLSEGERFVPFAMWGAGVARGRRVPERHSVMDLAPTISYLLGVEPPKGSTGRVLKEGLDLEGRKS
jgi:hypothetical protein